MLKLRVLPFYDVGKYVVVCVCVYRTTTQLSSERFVVVKLSGMTSEQQLSNATGTLTSRKAPQ